MVDEGDYINRLNTLAPRMMNQGDFDAEDNGIYNTMRVDRISQDTIRLFDLRTELQVSLSKSEFNEQLGETLFETKES